MAVPLKCFVAFLLLSMVAQGMSKCTHGEIEIGTERTGREVAGQLEWKVTVINTCDCSQDHVTLSCQGFSPVNPVESRLLLPQGDSSCLLIQGNTLPPKGTAQFTYAGEPYIFRPTSSNVDPSCRN